MNPSPYRESYQVNEIFHSIQGEGYWMGRFATFIRLQGCLVGCEWCDTKYTWLKGGTRMSVPEILDQVTTEYVIITGGEPTLYNLDTLLWPLQQEMKCYVALETSGQQHLKGLNRPDWITLSPKHRLNYKVPNRLAKIANEFKFVVDENLTLEIVLRFDNFWKTKPVYLMPEGSPPRQEMIERTLKWIGQHPSLRYSDRLQYRLGTR